MSHDVCFCYNKLDKDFVEELAHRLKDRHVDVWWDQSFKGGDDWIKVLEEIIPTCRIAVVFFGRNGLGEWQTREVKVLVQRSRRIIPVFLPTAPPHQELSPFLSEFHAIDFRDGSKESSLNKLHAGILGALNPSQENIVKHFDAVNKRMSAVDERVSAIDSHVGAVDERVSAIDGRVSTVDKMVAGENSKLKSALAAAIALAIVSLIVAASAIAIYDSQARKMRGVEDELRTSERSWQATFEQREDKARREREAQLRHDQREAESLRVERAAQSLHDQTMVRIGQLLGTAHGLTRDVGDNDILEGWRRQYHDGLLEMLVTLSTQSIDETQAVRDRVLFGLGLEWGFVRGIEEKLKPPNDLPGRIQGLLEEAAKDIALVTGRGMTFAPIERNAKLFDQMSDRVNVAKRELELPLPEPAARGDDERK